MITLTKDWSLPWQSFPVGTEFIPNSRTVRGTFKTGVVVYAYTTPEGARGELLLDSDVIPGAEQKANNIKGLDDV